MGPKSGATVVLLAAVACAISAYLTFQSPDNLVACTGDATADCAGVLGSKWSSWLGLPVSGAGMIAYASLALAAISVLVWPTTLGWGALLFSSTLGAGAAVWFTALQFLEVGALCPYCLAAHAFGTSAWLLVVADGLRQGLSLPNRIWFGGTLPAALAVSALIGGQIYDRFEVRVQFVDRWAQDAAWSDRVSSLEGGTGPSTDQTSPSQPSSSPGREVELVNGRLSMQLGEYPILGDPDAGKYIAVISDYTCPACRRLHHDLADAIERYDNQFAVVLFPMAFDSKCNPTVTETTFGHRNACLLAKLGLALWSIDPIAFRQFDRAVFEPAIPPDRAEVVALADGLVGPERLDQAMSNLLFDRMLYFSINLFYSPIVEKRVLPTILTPKGVQAGLPESIDALHKLLEESLELLPPAEHGSETTVPDPQGAVD